MADLVKTSGEVAPEKWHDNADGSFSRTVYVQNPGGGGGGGVVSQGPKDATATAWLVDASGFTVPISAVSLPLPTGAATDAVSQAIRDRLPATLDADGGLKIHVQNTITANIGTTNGLALDTTLTGGAQKAITRGGAKGTTVAADVTSTASGANHQAQDVVIYDASGNQIGLAATPIRVDPTGTTTQPVSGTVTANVGTSGSLALDATLTGGTQKAVVRGGAKGTTTAADVTSTASGANHQPLDIIIYDAAGNVLGASAANALFMERVAHYSGGQARMQTFAARLTTNATTTVTAATCAVSNIVYLVATAGTAWTLTIRDKSATPLVLLNSGSLTVGANPSVPLFGDPILMTGGIDIVTAGTTAGVLAIWVTYWQ